MARVAGLEKKNLTRNVVHETVDCTYTIFTDGDGRRYFQIDTYGRSDRQIPGKKSQTLQFDAAAVKRLLEILRQEF